MRKRVDFTVAHRGHSGEHHVEAVEPWPSLDVMEARRPRQSEHRQGNGDDPQVAQPAHIRRVNSKAKTFSELADFYLLLLSRRGIRVAFWRWRRNAIFSSLQPAVMAAIGEIDNQA